MDKLLSGKQKEILDFLNRQIQQKGYPPSVREICSAVGLRSTSTVHGYLQRLEKKGLIHKDPTKPRALRVTDGSNKQSSNYFMGKELVGVPVVGRVTAGQPILAVENIEDTFPLPVEYTGNSDSFMLKVRGDSMVDAGILDGDYILVRQQRTANNGDIVVALIEDEATVKRYYKENGYYRLQPENQYMEPIIVNDGLSILGKVTGVFRLL